MIRLVMILAGLFVAGSAHAQGCAIPGAHQAFAGRVVRVVDGDTLVLATGGCSALHVRLANYDAFEMSQAPLGPAERMAMMSIALGREASCRVTRGRRGNYRSYGRAMAVCAVGGRDLGEAMRAGGFPEGGR